MQNNKMLGVAAFIAAVALGYYYILYLPQRDTQTRAQQVTALGQKNAEKCARLGQEYFDAHYGQYENDSGVPYVVLDGPYFHFNKKEATCLLRYKLIIHQSADELVTNSYRVDDYIIDLYSGATRASAHYLMTHDEFASDFYRSQFEAFDNSYIELMNN